MNVLELRNLAKQKPFETCTRMWANPSYVKPMKLRLVLCMMTSFQNNLLQVPEGNALPQVQKLWSTWSLVVAKSEIVDFQQSLSLFRLIQKLRVRLARTFQKRKVTQCSAWKQRDHPALACLPSCSTSIVTTPGDRKCIKLVGGFVELHGIPLLLQWK